jgi:hypothetical protein
MPTVLRVLFSLGFLAAICAIGMIALVLLVESSQREFSETIPQERMTRHTNLEMPPRKAAPKIKERLQTVDPERLAGILRGLDIQK